MSARFAVMMLIAPIAVVTGLLRPIWGLYWLIVLYYFRPDIWDKPDWFQPVMWTSVASIIGWMLQAKDFRVTTPVLLAGFLILSMVVSSITARVDPEASFACTVVIIKLVTVMFLIIQLIRDLQTFWWFMWWNIIGNFWTLKTVLVLTASGGDASRVDVSSGQGGGANYLAMVFVMALPVFYFRYFYGSVKEKKWCLILAPLHILAMVGTGSRGGFLTLFVTMVYLLVRSKKLLPGLASMILMGGFLALVTPQEKWDRFMTTFADTSQERGFAANSRLILWEAGMVMFSESPVVGIGHDNFDRVSARYTGFFAGDTPIPYNPGLEQSRGYRGFVAHSTWVQALAEGGLIGAIPFFALFFNMFYVLRGVRRNKFSPGPRQAFDIASRCLEGVMIAFFVSSFFGSHFKIDFMWWYFGAVSALGLMADSQRAKDMRALRERMFEGRTAATAGPVGQPVTV